MPQTLTQLIAAGQVIYDETEDGANTHQRVGDAILQIPTTLAVPWQIMSKADQVAAEILAGIPYAQFNVQLQPAARIRPGMIFRIYGWPYVEFEDEVPSNIDPTLLGSTGVVTSVEDMTLELNAIISSTFGALSSHIGEFFPFMPAFVNVSGMEFRYKPQMVEILDT